MKTIKYLLTSLLLLCSMVVHAHDFKVDGIYYNITDRQNLTVSVTYEGTSALHSSCYRNKKLVIPSTVTYDGYTYTVTGIVGGAFQINDLSSLTIPKTVTDISYNIFYNFKTNNQTLSEIIVEEGNPKYDSRNNCNAVIETETNTLILGCNKTVIPQDIVSIASRAFDYCSALREVTIPDGVTSIGWCAFRGCANLTSVTIPDGVKTLESSVFEGCSGLTSVTLPNSMTSIESSAFSGCSNLTTITLPESLKSIGDRAFEGCKKISNIEIPGSVETIGHNAFNNCTGLSNFTLSEGLKSIGDYAFFGCTGITNITIPNSVTSIGKGVFADCLAMNSIVVAESNPVYDSRDNCNAIIETATDKLLLGCNTSIVPNTVKSIEESAFSNMRDLANVTLPEGLVIIGNNAFYNCNKLASITIPQSVTQIGDNAFAGCYNLLDVTVLATTPPTLGENAFVDERKAVLNYPENSNYTLWGKYFSNFSGLWNGGCYWVVDDAGNAYVSGSGALCQYSEREVKNLYIEEGITSIDDVSIYHKEALEKIHLPNSLETIGARSFSGCSSLTGSITIPEGMTSISESTFEGCSNLQEVILPESLTDIGDNAFYGCSKLKNINLPDGLLTIGNYAFGGAQVEFMVIPTSVRSIGDYAFESYDEEDGDYVVPTLVFKSFNGPTFGELYVNAFVPEGANSYPTGKFGYYELFYSQQECCIVDNKLFLFGNTDQVDVQSSINGYYIGSVERVVMTPDATGYHLISLLPNLKTVDVLKCGNPKEHQIFSINGSNAVFKRKQGDFSGEWDEDGNMIYSLDTVLVAGCAATAIPEGTTIIDNHAFYQCEGLTSINIPTTLKEIRDAFEGCINLKAVHIKDLSHWCSKINFGYNPLLLAGKLYLNGELITNLVLPNDITGVNAGAFAGATCLTSLEIPNNINYLGWGAFSGCTGLVDLVIPNNVTSIQSETFEGCLNLKTVNVWNSKISSREFADCTALETITIGKETSVINNDAFNGCTSLKNISIDIDNSVYDKREERNAIVETATNKLIYICKGEAVPSTITAIGGNAFNAFTDLDVTIPAFVTSIDERAFNGVNRTHFLSETPVEIGGNIFGWGAIYVPNGTLETYCSAPVWSDYKDRMVTSEIADKYVEVESTEGMSGVLNAIGLNEVDRVVKLKVKGCINSYDITVFRDKMPLLSQLDLSEATVIASSKPFYQTYKTGNNSLGGYAFYDLDKLAEVKLPKDLKTLGESAFRGSDKLMCVDASATGELNIGDYALYGCGKLKEFISPAKISEVGEYAFSECPGLENLELHNVTGSIGTKAFYYTNLSSVNISSVAGNIMTGAFKSCSIKKLYVDSIGGDIQELAFENCSNLQELRIGTMSGSLASEVFKDCPSLNNVEFQYGPTTIGNRIFRYSNNLESFVAGEGLTYVNDEAFVAVEYRIVDYDWLGRPVYGDVIIPRDNLKSVSLPQSVEIIGKQAFKDVRELCDFTIPQSLTSIGKGAFSGCTLIENVSIPNGVTTLSDEVFKGCSSLQSVSFSDGVTSIGISAFEGCTQLKDVSFPSTLTSIENIAFNGCAIEKLTLPPALKTIGNMAFSGCNNLTELHIPSAVENIGDQAFSGCSLLNDIYTYTVEPTTITETTFSTFNTATLHVPMTSFWNYYWNIGWSRFNHKLFQDFNKPYDYFYLNNDYYLNGSTGYIEGTPDADMRPGSGLIVESDKDAADDQQNLGDVTIGSDGNGNSGVIIGDENLHIDNLHVKINVKKGRWYFFAFPWDVPFKKISMQKGSDYVFRYYDGEERAKNGNGGWKNVNENHLKAARGYIFQSSADDVLMIAIEDVKFKKEDKYNDLVTHVSDNINDASWNLMGNPYLSYYDMSAMDYSAPVTVWDGEKYVAIRPGDDDYQFSPYEAFFVQKPEGTESVGFTAEDQMTKTQSETLKAQQAKARLARKVDVQRLLVNLVLEHDSVTDRTRVVFNNRQKMSYETACDAAKFETTGVPQLYTLDDDGVRYAINERPMNDGIVRIGFTASQSGEYTLDVARMDTEVVLYDAEMNVVHDFKNGAYAFYSDKGTFENRFTLGVPNNETTGVEEVELEQVVEVIEGGIAFSADATVTIYNAAGVAVATQHGAGTVMLQPGVYVVSVGNKNLKVVVK